MYANVYANVNVDRKSEVVRIHSSAESWLGGSWSKMSDIYGVGAHFLLLILGSIRLFLLGSYLVVSSL